MAKPALAKSKRIPKAFDFRFVEETTVPSVIFEAKVGKRSAYLDALQALANKPGSVMEVDGLGARASIYQQARKHNIKVLFGETNGKLYVKVMERESAESFVLTVLADGPLNLMEISSRMEKSYPDVKINAVLETLSNSGKIALRSVAGQPGVKKWYAI